MDKATDLSDLIDMICSECISCSSKNKEKRNAIQKSALTTLLQSARDKDDKSKSSESFWDLVIHTVRIGASIKKNFEFVLFTDTCPATFWLSRFQPFCAGNTTVSRGWYFVYGYSLNLGISYWLFHLLVLRLCFGTGTVLHIHLKLRPGQANL